MAKEVDAQTNTKACPSMLNIRGENFPCDMMRHMHPDCENHDGWAHANSEIEAIWQ